MGWEHGLEKGNFLQVIIYIVGGIINGVYLFSVILVCSSQSLSLTNRLMAGGSLIISLIDFQIVISILVGT